MPRTLDTMTLDTSRSVLDLVHRLLGRPVSDQPAIEALLQELAAAFDAPVCGLVSLPEGSQSFRHPDSGVRSPWPWSDDPSLLDRAAHPPGAVVVGREG